MARDDAESQGDDPGSIETGSVAKKTGTFGVTIGKIVSTDIAIGSGSSVRGWGSGPTDERIAEAQRRLQDFTTVLAIHQAEIADYPMIRQAVSDLQEELASPDPKLRMVRSLLGIIAAQVGGVASLQDPIYRILVILSHLD